MSNENSSASGTTIGYARTSTVDQRAGLDAQIAELTNAGCARVWSEQVSSVDSARPELRAALDWCRDGDTFVVTKPDRLARSVPDLLTTVKALKVRGVRVRILSMNVDTETATGNLILTVLGAVGEFERSIMLERQRHGVAVAKAKGLYKGRKPTARAKSKVVVDLHQKGVSVADICKEVGISRASVYRILKDAV